LNIVVSFQYWKKKLIRIDVLSTLLNYQDCLINNNSNQNWKKNFNPELK
jgi:hypothetical protein